MRLKVENFRQHKFFDITFPEIGLIRLSGKSGIGKTTVFDAIQEALFGTADDVYAWDSDSKSCKVELWVNGLYIKRTKGPNSLLVIYQEVEIINVEAQALIESVFGLNDSEFEVSSYIKQGQSNSPLTLTPADQLKFIQRLSTGNFDEGLFKSSVKEKINDIEKKIIRVSNDQKIIQNSIDQKTVNKAIFERHEKPIQPNDSFDLLKEKENHLKECIISESKKVEEYKKTLETLKKQSEIANKLLQLSIKIEQNEVDLADKVKEKDLLFNQAKSIEDIFTLNSYIQTLSEYNTYSDKLLSAQKLTQEIILQYPQVNSGLITGLSLLIEDKKTQLKDLRLNYNFLLSEVSLLKKYDKPLICPHCLETSYLLDNDLSKSVTYNVKDEIDKKNLLLKSSEQEILLLQNEIDNISNMIKKINNFKSELEKLKPIKPQPDQNVDYYTNLIHQKNNLSFQVKNCIRDIDKIVSQNTNLKIEKEELGSQKTLNTSADEVLGWISIHADIIDRLKTELTQVIIQLNNWANYHKDIFLWNSNQTVLIDLNKDIENLTNEYEKISNEYKELRKNQEDCLYILDTCDRASMASMEHIIHIINTNTAQWIDRMFPEDGTVLTFLNSSKTQKGDERAKMSVECYHKSKKVKKIKSLSGGERSRLTLCCQLGLSEMYNSPFLLVDEGFTGIDKEAQEECIQVLKEYSDKYNKLVICIEHNTSDHLFDSEIKLGE